MLHSRHSSIATFQVSRYGRWANYEGQWGGGLDVLAKLVTPREVDLLQNHKVFTLDGGVERVDKTSFDVHLPDPPPNWQSVIQPQREQQPAFQIKVPISPSIPVGDTFLIATSFSVRRGDGFSGEVPQTGWSARYAVPPELVGARQTYVQLKATPYSMFGVVYMQALLNKACPLLDYRISFSWEPNAMHAEVEVVTIAMAMSLNLVAKVDVAVKAINEGNQGRRASTGSVSSL